MHIKYYIYYNIHRNEKFTLAQYIIISYYI